MVKMRFLFLNWCFIIAFYYSASVNGTCKKAPHDPEVACGVRGKPPRNPFRRSLIANAQEIGSINACRDLCNRRGHICGMFNYNTTSSLCYLSHDIGRAGIREDKSSDRIFYSMKCFDCPPLKCAIPSKVANLIDNPGFEKSAKYIGPWSSADGEHPLPRQDSGRPSVPGIGSLRYLRCQRSRFFEQYYRHCPNQTQKVEFDIYNVVHDRDFNLPKLEFGGYRKHSVTFHPKGPTGPTPRRVKGFYTPRDAITMALIDCNGFTPIAQASFDNVLVRHVDLSTAKFISKEKVVNPGFETGSTDPWMYSSNNLLGPSDGHFKLVSPGLDSSDFALQFKGNESTGIDVSLQPRLQNLTLNTGSNRLYRLKIDVRPSQPFTIFFGSYSEIIGSSLDPQYFYLTSIMLPISLGFSVHGPTPVLFDNLSIREITDPT